MLATFPRSARTYAKDQFILVVSYRSHLGQFLRITVCGPVRFKIRRTAERNMIVQAKACQKG